MAYELQNHMEIVVDRVLPGLMKEYDVCDCQRCFMDTKALTLNQLDPKYVVSLRGELMMDIDSTMLQHQADVLSAALKAIQKVSKNPRHDDS